jgi:anaphase-promoting complex subunit 6
MSSGRSPYPTRSRSRRLQQQQQRPQQASSSILLSDDTPPEVLTSSLPRTSLGSISSSTNFRLGQGLVQAKLSPLASSSSANRKSFFPPTLKETNDSTDSKRQDIAFQVTSLDVKEDLRDGIPLVQLRKLAKHNSGSISVFYAGICHAKTQSKEDAFLFAQTLFQNKECKRAVRLLETTDLLQISSQYHQLSLQATLLAAQALSELEEWQSVLQILEENSLYASFQHPHQHQSSFCLEDDDDIAWLALGETLSVEQRQDQALHPLALLLNLRANAYAKTGHPLRASTFWKKALNLDPLCVQALDGLLESSNNMDNDLSPNQIIESLDFPPHFEWLRDFYLAKLHVTPSAGETTSAAAAAASSPAGKTFWHEDASSIQLCSPKHTDANSLILSIETPKHSSKSSSPLDKLWNVHKLDHSSQVLAMAAQRAYQNHKWPLSLNLCEQLAKIDPLCPTAAFVHVATLTCLNKKRQLFQLAHDWVDASPKSSKAWFAVGAYYYTCGRYHVAQRHFCRSTRLDPHSPEAWIAFGASFAMCDESDQALASFRAAQRLSPGDSTSLLYIGMEYLRTNHMVLANHFLQAAYQANPMDPLVANELGVLYMMQPNPASSDTNNTSPTQKFELAVEWLTKALVLASGSNEDKSITELLHFTTLDPYWEPALFNLATVCRKLRRWDVAIDCLNTCLSLKESASAYSALGYCSHLSGNLHEAIEHYHISLSKKPDDPFCSEMLQRALSDALDEHAFFPNDDTTASEDFATTPMSTTGKVIGALAIDQSSMLLSTNTSVGGDNGFSFSVEEDSDVDMG